MLHPSEDLDLTFDALSELLSDVFHGHRELWEKVDGQGILVSVHDGELRAARNGSDLIAGGVSVPDMLDRFCGHPAEVPFSAGLRALSGLDLTCLAPLTSDGSWLVCEVVCADHPNVIRHSGNHVVVHSCRGPNGATAPVRSQDLGTLAGSQVTVDGRPWLAHGALPVALSRELLGPSDEVLEVALGGLHREMWSAGLLGSSSLRDYAAERLRRILGPKVHLPFDRQEMVVARVAGLPGALPLADIKLGLGADARSRVSEVATVEGARRTRSEAVLPLHSVVVEFGARLLRGCGSALVDDAAVEVERLRSLVRDLPEGTVGVPRERDMAAIEGLVVWSGGTAHKLTGSFAALNRILGQRRYPTRRLSKSRGLGGPLLPVAG